MIEYKKLMVEIKNKKCTHKFTKENETCICPDCWLDLVTEKVIKRRGKTYR